MPSFTAINEDGKKISEIILGYNVTEEVKGSIEWILPENTVVLESKEYEWIFTPEDSENYNLVKGASIIYPHLVHKYDNDCDEQCNICCEKRNITHNYTIKFDEENHWHACNVCGKEEENSRKSHDGGKASCLNKAICTICNSEYGEVDLNNHEKDTYVYMINDSITHTKKYECCNSVASSEEHKFGEWLVIKEATEEEDGEKKRTCVCGFEEIEIIKHSHNHSYSEEYKYNAEGHWHECKCGERLAVEEHTFGNWLVIKEATEEEDGEKRRTCVCGFEEIEIIKYTSLPQSVTLEDTKTGVKIITNGDVVLPDNTILLTSDVLSNTSSKNLTINQSKVFTTDYSGKIKAILDISLMNDDVKVDINDNVTVELAIPSLESDESYETYQVYYVDDLNNIQNMNAEVKDGKIVFTTNHFSKYAVIGINTNVVDDTISTFAIVLIIIGGILIIGTCVFSVYWFVIKKKKFSDLFNILKKS